MDAGIWRRLIVIPFNAVIESSSDVKNYADHLYETAGGAVLAWIMEGSRLIHAEDYQLTPPAQVVAASSAYRKRTTGSPNSSTPAARWTRPYPNAPVTCTRSTERGRNPPAGGLGRWPTSTPLSNNPGLNDASPSMACTSTDWL